MKNILIPILFLIGYEGAMAQLLNYHDKNEKHIYTNTAHRKINNFPDSARIEFPDQNILLVVEAQNFNHSIDALKAMTITIGDLLKTIEASREKNKLSAPHRVNVVVNQNGFKEISITEKTEARTKVLVSDKQIIELLPPGWEIFIQQKNTRLYVYAEDIRHLKKLTILDFESVITKLSESKTFSVGRKSVKSRFIVRNGSVEYKDIKYYHPLDLISLSASAGAGVLRNKIYPELSGSLGIYLADRYNRNNHRLELSYSSMYFAENKPEGGYSNNISSFLSFSYSKNISKGDEPVWMGLGAGHLIQKAGDFNFFTGKTTKFFLIINAGSSNLSIIPEYYLTDDYKKALIGLKLHYRF